MNRLAGMALCVTALFATGAARAQQTSQGGTPPGTPPPVAADQTTEAEESATEAESGPAPDTRPLAGVEDLTVGLRQRPHSYVLPSFHLAGVADTNSRIVSGGGTRMESAEIVSGRLAAQHVGPRSLVTLDYVGGGWIYNRRSDLNSAIHQVGLSAGYVGRRWALTLGDRATYLPESPFGLGGFGGLGGLGTGIGFGAGLGTLNPFFSPNQSILSGRGGRTANVSIFQLNFKPGRRSTITMSASYGILKFQEPGFIDSDQRVFMAGYDYALTRKDTIAIAYGAALFRYQGIDLGFDEHLVQLSYGRRVTGRLALQLAGGAQLGRFPNAVAGSTEQISWNAHSGLHYRWPTTDLGLSYSHYTGNGSGVLIGADYDLFYVNLDRRLTRNWWGSLSPGYSHSGRLRQTTAGAAGAKFDSAYGGASLRRAIGRYMDVSLSYHMQYQHSDVIPSVGGVRRAVFRRHLFGLSFNWHGRRMDID